MMIINQDCPNVELSHVAIKHALELKRWVKKYENDQLDQLKKMRSENAVFIILNIMPGV